ncbi:hypothetical protein GOM49_01010 [Clostridium bovifaecis]|uniref:Mannosyl-glycoprotein endo-beta-N-acetylglucosamidase-like domain-containing protein n=1 Tax=Clostridium bovifaecis TaxID=2184719 RepID=A0A6I6EN54_9CLOT|nr:hypothetical protein GOM49_01010 [Clostridium bovifaecis]
MISSNYIFKSKVLAQTSVPEDITISADKLMKSKNSQEKFIGTVLEGAVKNYEKYKVLPSVTIAQAILESGWGKSDKAVKYSNLFGIKADKSWKGKKVKLTSKEWSKGKMRTVTTYWRVYDSIEASILDHGNFLATRPWYTKAGVFKANNYVQQISAIKKGGYCTDPKYVSSICRIINTYDLWKYDPKGKEIKL